MEIPYPTQPWMCHKSRRQKRFALVFIIAVVRTKLLSSNLHPCSDFLFWFRFVLFFLFYSLLFNLSPSCVSWCSALPALRLRFVSRFFFSLAGLPACLPVCLLAMWRQIVRTNQIPRMIPQTPWYVDPKVSTCSRLVFFRLLIFLESCHILKHEDMRLFFIKRSSYPCVQWVIIRRHS